MNPSFDSGEAKSFTDKPSELAERLYQVRDFVSNNLEKAREDQKRFADKHRDEAPIYSAGDKVMLSAKNITTLRPKVKWSNKFMGPYKTLGQAGNNAYKLDLPKSLNIHPVFHTSLLLPYRQNTIENRVQAPPPPVVIDFNVEWEVDSVIDSRWFCGKLQYLVKWKGYDKIAPEWLYADAMNHCKDAIDDFKRYYDTPRPQKRRKQRK